MEGAVMEIGEAEGPIIVDSRIKPEGVSFLDKLETLLSEQYELDIFRPGALLMGHEPFLQPPSIEIPDFGELVDVERVEDTVYWKFEVPMGLDDLTSLKSSSKQTALRNKYKLRHEFVCECLAEAGTDRRLDQVFGRLGDEDDKITPDIIHVDRYGTRHVIEVGTNRSPSSAALYRAFQSKMFKYEMPLRNRRLEDPVTYTVILVGVHGVVSNHMLPIALINDLVVRMAIAVAVENQAKGKGIDLSSESGDSVYDRNAAMIMETVSLIGPGPAPGHRVLGITPEFIESVLEDPKSDAVVEDFKGSINRTKTLMAGQTKQLQVLREEMKKIESLEGKRSDLKPIAPLPFLSVKPDGSGIGVKFVSPGHTSTHVELSNIWTEALSKIGELGQYFNEDSQSLLKEAYSTTKSTTKRAEDARRANRRKWHRVTLKKVVSGPLKKYLQKDGIFGKGMEKDPAMRARKRLQKRPFWINTGVKDIEQFLSDPSHLENHGHTGSVSSHLIKPLLDRADEIAGNNGEASEHLLSWSKTKLFDSLDIISDIAYELAAAVKQNTNTAEFLLKKIRDRPIYLLIKPTNSRSHVFYSVMMTNMSGNSHSHGTVFRPMHDIGLISAAEFCSVKASKIENLANASSLLLSLAAFWAEFYGLPDASPDSFKAHEDAMIMLLYTILVALEDKACTEEIITNTRYMYMEIFKGNVNIMKPRPFKMMKKMPQLLRSRLSVFTLRRIIRNFSSMVTHPPKRVDRVACTSELTEDDAPPDDSWEGLKNFLTGGPIHSASMAINLMYIGYFKNKNQETEGNSEWKMVEKILEEEFGLNYLEKNKSLGAITPGERLGKKQFDKNCIMHGSQILEQRLKRTLGPNWKDQLEKEICSNLARHLTHEIATLKASSLCDHNTTSVKSKFVTEKSTWRVKVIEAIASKLGMTGLNPIVHIDKVITFIENSSKGVMCDLFKKNQHGGLREIYVLTLESRIVQLFLETISRTICSHFEEETLTHPGNKMRILDNHKTRMAREARKSSSVFGDLCSSSDKTRWNQNFVMPAMSIPLLRMTTKKFHNAISRIFNMWANKLILIPPNVVNLLIKQTALSSPVYMELMSKYWGRAQDTLNDRGVRFPLDRYLNLTTGMMQGILHYTSSLLHLTFLSSSKSLCLSTLRKKYPHCRFFMAQVCSSDDSASILTVMTSGDSEKLSMTEFKAFYEADLLSETLTDFCSYYCMRESEKSTISVYDYVEFNSEFLLKNTLSIPTIKFVAASLNLTESSSFMGRFQTMYNLISSLRSSGLSAHSTYLCQVSQAYQHYKTMGSATSSLFPRFQAEILHTPSPVHGFFLFDSKYVTGILGYSFCRWLLYQNCAEESQRLSSISVRELEVMPDGGVVEALRVKHGDNIRWHKMLDRIETGHIKVANRSVRVDRVTGLSRVDQDMVRKRESLINADPELFFREPLTPEELKKKLLIKASMPGVADSLGKGNPFIQSLALSVYCLYAHAFTQTTVKSRVDETTGAVKKVKTTVKHSLLSSLREHKELPCRLADEEVPSALIEEMFPLHHKFEDALDIIETFKTAKEVSAGRFRIRTSNITVQPKTSSLPLSLLQVAGRLWYSRPVRCSNRVFQRCLEQFRECYPWISGTFEETLDASPFEKPIELYNFLSTQNSRSRRFRIFGPAIYSTRFTGQLVQAIKKGYKRDILLLRVETDHPGPEALDRKTAELTLALQIPFPKIRKNRAMRVLGDISDLLSGPEDLPLMNRRDAKVGLIALYSDDRIYPEIVPQQLKNINQGILVTFTKEQRRVWQGDVPRWEGTGEAVVLADGMQMIVNLQGDQATKVTVRSYDVLRQNPSTLRQVFDKLQTRALSGFQASIPCTARFNGTNFVSSCGTGTPIIVDRFMEDVYVDTSHLRMRVVGGECGISQMIKGKNVMIVGHRSGNQDVSLYSSGGIEGSIWDAWIGVKKLAYPTAYREILRISNLGTGVEDMPDYIRSVQHWFRTSFHARLKFKGLGYSPFSYAESAAVSVDPLQDIDDSELDAIMEEINKISPEEGESGLFGMFSQRILESVQEEIEDKAYEEGEEGVDLAALGLEGALTYAYELTPFRNLLSNVTHEETEVNRATVGRQQMNYLYLHPLWDDFIEHVERDDPDFFFKTLQGVVSARNPDTSRDIMKFLDLKERTIESTIAERFSSIRQSQLDGAREDEQDDPEDW